MISTVFTALASLHGLVPLAQDSMPFDTTIGSEGCVIEQITTGDFDHYGFQPVSMDGRWLSVAWSRGEDENGVPIRGAYGLDLQTGERLVYADPINNSGSFSPDGQRLVGAQYGQDGRTDILEYVLATSEIRSIAPDPAWDFLPSYSPDGRSILFNSYRADGDSELYLFQRGDGTLKRLTHLKGYDAQGEFSPDGLRILFHHQVSERDGGGYDFDLYALDLATGSLTRLTDSPYEESYGTWAPDGQAFAYSTDVDQRPEQHDLHVRLDNGQTLRLTRGDWKDSYAFWTRDGRFLYFNSNRSGVTHLYRMAMDGLDCRRAPGSDLQPNAD